MSESLRVTYCSFKYNVVHIGSVETTKINEICSLFGPIESFFMNNLYKKLFSLYLVCKVLLQVDMFKLEHKTKLDHCQI